MQNDSKDKYVIRDLQHLIELWMLTYNKDGKLDWSHIIPYYHENINFRDSIQEINGIKDFKAMVERLTKRTKALKMKIVNAVQNDKIILIEWEMTILFGKTRTSVLYGCSKVTLNNERKIIAQRDYYDLWGDIFDNIPGFSKMYRKFMKKVFG